MRVLFIHRDFPSSFRAEAQYFGAMPENTVLFPSERGGKEARLAGVRRLRIAPSLPAAADESPCGRSSSLFLKRAAQTARALQRLKDSGFAPDLICCSADGGYGLYIKDIFPDAFLVARAEWFEKNDESFRFFTRGAARPAADFAAGRIRNMFRTSMLLDCDAAFTGSAWQKSRFPAELQPRLEIFSDGVDSSFFSPEYSTFPEIPEDAEILSFCCKGNDPARGLMTFVQALPQVLEKREHCFALIMDSRPAMTEGEKNETAALLDRHLPPPLRRRVLTPAYSLGAYRQMLRASALHVYLTAPQSLSAGLFEAMSCGTLTLGSDTPPVREVIQHGINGFLCDFWDHREMADSVSSLLELAPRFASLRQAARDTVVRHHDRGTQTVKKVEWMLKALQKRDQTRPQSEVSPASFSRA